MRRNSLRLRLVAGGAVAIAVALAIAGVALTLLFERHVARTVAPISRFTSSNSWPASISMPNGQLVLTRPPADPRFSDPLSGLYWQIGDDRKQLLRSRSLWDTTLSLPLDDPSPGQVHQHELAGPAGSRVLLVERRVQLTIGNQSVPVRVGGRGRSRPGIGRGDGLCVRPRPRAGAARRRSGDRDFGSGRTRASAARRAASCHF